MSTQTSVIKQEPGDELMLITEGEFEGHEAIVKPLANGFEVLVLAKNSVTKSGLAKVIEHIQVDGERPQWLKPSNVH